MDVVMTLTSTLMVTLLWSSRRRVFLWTASETRLGD